MRELGMLGGGSNGGKRVLVATSLQEASSRYSVGKSAGVLAQGRRKEGKWWFVGSENVGTGGTVEGATSTTTGMKGATPTSSLHAWCVRDLLRTLYLPPHTHVLKVRFQPLFAIGKRV